MKTTETLAGSQRLDYIANNDKLHVTVDKDLVGVLAGTGSYKRWVFILAKGELTRFAVI